MDSIRIGIIGAGQNTQKTHIPNLLSIPGVRIVSVANRSATSGQAVASRFGIPSVMTDWREVAASSEVDAVVIGTWPYLHCEAACLALESGKHVLCEARMSMDRREAVQMLETSRRHPHLIAQLVPSPFTLRVDKTIQRFLSQNKLGKLRSIHFQHQVNAFAATGGDMLHWRRDIRYNGKNAMVLGIAYESVLRWLGSAAWVSAVGAIFKDRALDPDTGREVAVQIPDYLSVQMSLPNGVMGSFLISEIGIQAGPPCFQIFGEEGMLQYDFKTDGTLWHAGRCDNEKKPVAVVPEDAGKWRVEEEFINAIRGQERIQYTTFGLGERYMAFTDAVDESRKRFGARVMI